MKRFLIAAVVASCGAVGLSVTPVGAHWIDSPGTAQFEGGGLFVDVPDHTKGFSCAEKVSPVINRPVLDPTVPCFGG